MMTKCKCCGARPGVHHKMSCYDPNRDENGCFAPPTEMSPFWANCGPKASECGIRPDSQASGESQS